MKTTRLWALIGAAGLAISFTAAGAGTRKAQPPPPQQATPHPAFSKLSASQVKARSSGKQERMVVVFDNQLTNLPANRAHRQRAGKQRPRRCRLRSSPS